MASCPKAVLASFHNPQILLSPTAQVQMQAQFAELGPQGGLLFEHLLGAVKAGLVQGIHSVFVLSLVITALGLVAVFFLQEIELRGGRRGQPRGEEASRAPHAEPVSFGG